MDQIYIVIAFNGCSRRDHRRRRSSSLSRYHRSYHRRRNRRDKRIIVVVIHRLNTFLQRERGWVREGAEGGPTTGGRVAPPPRFTATNNAGHKEHHR